MASQVALLVKNAPASARDVRDMGSIFPCWEDALEEGMATHSSILAWRIPCTEESGGLQSTGSKSQTWLKRLSANTQSYKHTLSFYFSLHFSYP